MHFDWDSNGIYLLICLFLFIKFNDHEDIWSFRSANVTTLYTTFQGKWLVKL
jgi:hypothetical protein